MPKLRPNAKLPPHREKSIFSSLESVLARLAKVAIGIKSEKIQAVRARYAFGEARERLYWRMAAVLLARLACIGMARCKRKVVGL